MFVLEATIVTSGLAALCYIIYERHFHPLAKFQGPFWASLTDFWRFYHEIRGDLPHVLHLHHKRYGPIVRVAPNELNFSTADVVEVVYRKGGRDYPKSQFYDGFTTINPNVFGTRDEDLHALRRRQMAHGFSQATFMRMEHIFDKHVRSLISRLATHAHNKEMCDLKTIFRAYGYDANLDLSLGQNPQSLKAPNPLLVLPPMNDQIVLSKLTGYVPWLKPYLANYGKMVPWEYLRHLLRSRALLKLQAEEATAVQFERIRDKGEDTLLSVTAAGDDQVGHTNLLQELARAKEPTTGEVISQAEVASNALAFLVAGSHSTATSLIFFFWHLLHNPPVMQKVVAEITKTYNSTLAPDAVPPYEGMEAQLPYTSAVLKETFRLTPTVQHPLPRITPSDRQSARFPTIIADTVIPPNVAVAASIRTLHWNPDLWGADAEQFNPERWLQNPDDDNNIDIRHNERYLMQFGAGHRMCIGKNQALIVIWKAAVQMLRNFDVALLPWKSLEEPINVRVRGFAELVNPFDVIVTPRAGALKT